MKHLYKQSKNSAIEIPIYETTWTKKRTGERYTRYVITWRDAHGRHRESKNTLAKAKTRADQLVTSILNGQLALESFTPADRASLERARELLATAGPGGTPIPVEIAAGAYAGLLSTLGGAASPEDAIRWYMEHRPPDVLPQNIPDLVQDLLAAKKNNGAGKKYLATLGKQLDRFAEKFGGPLHLVQSHEITTWLDALKVGLRSRKNYRNAVRTLVEYARTQRRLAVTWTELDRVAVPQTQPIEVRYFTPDQLTALLCARQQLEEARCARRRPVAAFIPFLSLVAFGGIRHEELADPHGGPVLDWSHIHLDRATIRVPANVSKVKTPRLIEMRPNLIAWLAPHARNSGKVCEISNPSNLLTKTLRLAGLPAARGQMSNALRSSFISYRTAATGNIGQVALEAGTSPGVIKKHYLELVTKEQADRYFNIQPTTADIIQLRFAGL